MSGWYQLKEGAILGETKGVGGYEEQAPVSQHHRA